MPLNYEKQQRVKELLDEYSERTIVSDLVTAFYDDKIKTIGDLAQVAYETGFRNGKEVTTLAVRKALDRV